MLKLLLKWIFFPIQKFRLAMVDSNKIFKDKQVAKLADAVKNGDSKAIKALVAEGVDPNSVGKDDTNLLFWAILMQNTKGFTALLEAGADPTICGNDGRTLMHTTAWVKDISYLKILLKHGVDPNIQNCLGRSTPIFDAVEDEHFTLLLNSGANLSAKDIVGNTILHSASPRHIIQLLEAGADPLAKNNRGDTFQSYFFSAPENVLTKEAKQDRKWVRDWLKKKNIPLEEK